MGKYDHIDFRPPKSAREAAEKGLEWRRKHNRGGTAVGVARARDIKNGKSLSPSTVRRIKAYFDRHQSDKAGKGWRAGEEGYPSAGKIAWYLWGADACWSWAKKIVRQMEAADNKSQNRGASMVERRSLCADAETAMATPLLRVESRCECDDSGDEDHRDWIVGYAAKFNENSLEIDGEFIERIDPRAFRLVTERRGRRKPLQTRALFNHDPNQPLARYPKTLRLYVDDVGLRYEFPVPRSTYGEDLAQNIRDSIVTGSSFSFTVAKGGEEWMMEEGRSVRLVKSVDSLIDVGPVTFPAYESSEVSVARRSFDAFRRSQGQRTPPSRRGAQTHRRELEDIKRFLNSRRRRHV